VVIYGYYKVKSSLTHYFEIGSGAI